MRLRFAPSPTGYIHVGNVRTILFNYLYVKKENGKLILRIEDTDIERSLKEYEESLIDDLKWLGIEWDEGPDRGGNYGPYRQSERLDLYKSHGEKLIKEGKAYYCFCSPQLLEKERKQALKKGIPPRYSGRCRSLSIDEAKKRISEGEKPAIRFKMPQDKEFKYNDIVRDEISFDLSLFGDFVLVRSTGLPSYNFSVVVDDHYMNITHVIRGEDHISNTPKQIKIYKSFGWIPPKFGHLSMVLGPDGSALSKRHGATSLNQFRKMGYLPEAIINYLALLGWAPPEGEEILSKNRLLNLFDINKVSKSGAVFDYDKLNWVNRKHLSKMDEGEILKRASNFLVKHGIIKSYDSLSDQDINILSSAIKTTKSNLIKFSDIPEELKVFFEYKVDKQAFEELKNEDKGLEILNLLYDKFKSKEDIDFNDIFSFIKEAKKQGIKGKSLFHPMRIIFTGQSSGVELDKFLEIITKSNKLNIKKKPLSLKERLIKAKKIIEEKEN